MFLLRENDIKNVGISNKIKDNIIYFYIKKFKMKKLILIFGIFLMVQGLHAQFYATVGGGIAFPAGKAKLGEKIVNTDVSDLEGSYGEGFNVQARLGYYVTPKLAVELGVGYLHGADQAVQQVESPGTNVDFKARGRAIGGALALKYDLTNNFYARAGAVTKLAGKTELVGSNSVLLPTADPSTFLEMKGDITRDFHGKFSLGFIGAIGYQYMISDGLQLFVEAEYIGLNVDGNTSELADFTGSLAGESKTAEEILGFISSIEDANTRASLLGAFPVFGEVTYVDNPTQANEQPTRDPAPYSSIGLNVGVTFKF